MSWMTQLLGVDAQAEQQSAINRQQGTFSDQMNWNQSQLTSLMGKMDTNASQYSTAANQEANYLTGLGNQYDTWAQQSTAGLDSSATELKAEYQGALKDIYSEGRNQAASSGLIGGFQESEATSPQIAALGRSYASNLASYKNTIANQKASIGQTALQGKTSLGTQASQLRLSPYAMNNQNYSNLTSTLAGLYGQSASNYGQSMGNYAESANPLGNLLGAAAGVAGGAGSLMAGGSSAGLWGNNSGYSSSLAREYDKWQF